MTKEDNEDFKNSTKCWICDNNYVDNDVKVKDHCHITEKYRDSPYRDCKNSCRISQPKKIWFSSYYARARQIQS